MTQIDKMQEKSPPQIRAALVKPIALKRIPGYILVMSLDNGKLKFLEEFQHFNVHELISNLLALEDKHRYTMLYTIIERVEKLTDMFFIELHKRCREQIPWVQIAPAPYASDINHGLDILTNMVNFGMVDVSDFPEDSMLYTHMRLERDVIPDEGWYAFHALRYIVGGLSVYKDINPDKVSRFREDWLEAQKSIKLSGMSLAAHKLIQDVKRDVQQQEERWNDDFFF